MFICSIVILVEFKKINENYACLLSDRIQKFNARNFFQKMKKNRQICLIILYSCAYFFYTMLQYWICFFLFIYKKEENEIFSELNSTVYIFLYTNNAFNFFIYGFSSEKYRVELISMFRHFLHWVTHRNFAYVLKKNVHSIYGYASFSNRSLTILLPLWT